MAENEWVTGVIITPNITGSSPSSGGVFVLFNVWVFQGQLSDTGYLAQKNPKHTGTPRRITFGHENPWKNAGFRC